MFLRKSLLLFLVFFLCIGGMAHAEYVKDGGFDVGYVAGSWSGIPDPAATPPNYVDRNSDFGNFQGQIGYSATTPATGFFGTNNYAYTGRIFQNLSDNRTDTTLPPKLTPGVYTITFEANLIDDDDNEFDEDMFRFVAYTFRSVSEGGDGQYTEIYASPLVEGDGNGATGFLPYSYTLDFSDWDGGTTSDAWIAFLFNEQNDFYGAGVTVTDSTYEYFKVDNVSMVPLPGAIWFLGSGIVAIIGSRKKFKKS